MIATRVWRWLAVLFVAAVCLSLTSCASSKVNKTNFEKISSGMTEEEVEAILGKGDEQAEINMPNMGINMPNMGGSGIGRAMKVKTWQEGSKSINITFKDGKVLGKIASGL
jgi:hypothetical protein